MSTSNWPAIPPKDDSTPGERIGLVDAPVQPHRVRERPSEQGPGSTSSIRRRGLDEARFPGLDDGRFPGLDRPDVTAPMSWVAPPGDTDTAARRGALVGTSVSDLLFRVLAESEDHGPPVRYAAGPAGRPRGSFVAASGRVFLGIQIVGRMWIDTQLGIDDASLATELPLALSQARGPRGDVLDATTLALTTTKRRALRNLSARALHHVCRLAMESSGSLVRSSGRIGVPTVVRFRPIELLLACGEMAAAQADDDQDRARRFHARVAAQADDAWLFVRDSALDAMVPRQLPSARNRSVHEVLPLLSTAHAVMRSAAELQRHTAADTLRAMTVSLGGVPWIALAGSSHVSLLRFPRHRVGGILQLALDA